jgi:hypothetical protein
MLSYESISQIEHVHPLDGGIVRRKVRRDRRPGLPKESRARFYARYVAETLRKNARLAAMYLRYERTQRRVLREPLPDLGGDVAMQPVSNAELDSLALFTATTAARSVAERAKQTAVLRAGISAL